MGRFLKELRYSLGMKRHIFFIILVCFIACGASWLFQDTLTKELKKSFPGQFAPDQVAVTPSQYHLSGKVAQSSPQVADADLKAEIQLNRNLRNAAWITSYEEILTQFVQIQSFRGPDSAIKGYLTDEAEENRDVDLNGVRYTTVNAIWMEQSVVEKYNLGSEAKHIFSLPNDYLGKIYVVLGAEYKKSSGYSVGTILEGKNEFGSLKMQVVGFLDRGASVMIAGEKVNLDSYILCPFISLQDVYEIKDETPHSYIEGVYLPTTYVDESISGVYLNTPPNSTTDSGMLYMEVRSLWIERTALAEENAPEWLKQLLPAGDSEKDTRIIVGASYGAEKITHGMDFDMKSADKKKLFHAKVSGVLEAGTTYNVLGIDIVLDDYIIFLQPASATDDSNKTTEGEGDTETALIDDPIGPKEREFKVDERGKLFHYQFAMNNGYFTTTLTADEAQQEIDIVVSNSWSDFLKNNPKKAPLTHYRVATAHQANNILFRENASDLASKVLKFTKYGFFISMLLTALYLFWKFYRGKDFYSALYLTGTNRTEMMAMYFVEGALMAALAALGSIGFAFVVCKLLQLDMCATKPLINRIIKLVGIPTGAIMIWIMIRDFGRMFRRTQEV
ncbi:MAG: hypothetical protein J5795_04360 [Lachnospiraceae bacterium]|nr:hypothetical protein [Lachnospiraceae bacterium]